MENVYSEEALCSVFELGRMYYEMGYSLPAERVFHGLAAVDRGLTPSRIGLGLVKLERSLFDEAAFYFRGALQEGNYSLEAKLGLCAAFIGSGDIARAKSLLLQLATELEKSPRSSTELRTLWEAFALRCDR